MIVEGSVLAIDRANIDTDQIIPARFLSGIDRKGVGEHLFEGLPGGDALLASRPGAPILVTRENFGCGSSREHAVWALQDRGFRAVVAPSFARIFQENAYIGGMIPVVVAPEHIDALIGAQRMWIDADGETLRADGGEPIAFSLDPLRKRFILEGGFYDFLNAKIPQIRSWLEARPV